MFTFSILLALIIIGFTAYFVLKGSDVRLVLFSAGLLLAFIGLKPWVVLDTFQKTMGDGKIIGPICSAMGFAFVVRITGCDREMVRMLIGPIRKIKWLLLPGGCIIGFLTNMAITSQTGAAAAVGTVLMPLMVAAGYHPIIAGATLVLGCSAGGNLFNPGDPDIVAIQTNANVPFSSIIDTMVLPELVGFITAVAAFVFFSFKKPSEKIETQFSLDNSDEEPINFLKAFLPPLPIFLLFITQPRLGLLPLVLDIYPDGLPVPHAMVISTIIVFLVIRKDLSLQTKQFFEGLGFAYINVISLIITANCFIAGLDVLGLTKLLVSFISGSGFIGKIASAIFPGMLAILSGSGTAPSVSFSQVVLPSISAINPTDAVNLGVIGAIGATLGRTMSPVAAVVIFTSTLMNITPIQIVKRTGPPLLLGMMAMLFVMIFK